MFTNDALLRGIMLGFMGIFVEKSLVTRARVPYANSNAPISLIYLSIFVMTKYSDLPILSAFLIRLFWLAAIRELINLNVLYSVAGQ